MARRGKDWPLHPHSGHFQPKQRGSDVGVAKGFETPSSFGNLFFKSWRLFTHGKLLYLTLTLEDGLARRSASALM